ncbi:amidase family protein [Kineosporia sp. NBRC 101731]|uniref:amidase n=1 Tax=Kineosporia sp. NBRC 101731 TaxID=3032199 RepID=UPI0024A21AD1|nr:amidase family protein [Kineosporia sp. NBRC 101731]GLY30964.1 amidase [Kineosporia sp. NBRC 101731]
MDLETYKDATALELGALVADGQVSPVELASCALEIAEAAEPTINAYAAILRERALADAAVRESEARAGHLRGPLHGVPIAIKDNMLYRGEPTWKGSLTTSDAPAKTSAPMVQRLLNAGTVIIGRTTTPEMGWKGTGISPRTGITRNPWDPSRNSGGSSAGAGATVASGAVPIATGTDAGGSVRIPASFCGVVGLKPTLSTIPLWPGTVNESLSHAGPLTRSVADAHSVLRITRGPDPRDPQSYWSPPVPDEPGRRLRIGLVRAPFGIAPDSTTHDVLAPAYETLLVSGTADFTEIDLPDLPDLPRQIFEDLWVTGRGLGFLDLAEQHGDLMDPGLVRLGPLAEQYSLADHYSTLTARRAFNAALSSLLDAVDLLVMPTLPLTAFAADAEVPEGGEAGAPLPWITWTPYTYPFNITGQPAISLPCGFDPHGLPVGLQIVGPWAGDDRVLTYAATAEHLLSPLVPARHT